MEEFNATVANIKDLAGEIIRLAPNIPSEASIVLKNIDSPTFLMHFISSNLNNCNIMSKTKAKVPSY